ncbi:MAG: phage Gp37/Gp68 family protein [Chloroflexaceae bacterium]|nr:phage Gp37/Gp68 family protein [Chloroflexaceae bacterium]
MAEYSSIEWTDHTFNPWWGCTKISAGCTHCYAETWAQRYGQQLWGKQSPRRLFGQQHWQQSLRWNRQAEAQKRRFRVFCASMADVFEDHPDVDRSRQQLWQVIAETPNLDWLLLTKRPENIASMLPVAWRTHVPSHVWLMTSVENQQQAETRIPVLLGVPARLHALSVEPMLANVDLTPWMASLQWVIVGGESGHNARPLHPVWVRTIRDQCLAANVAFFFKQWGAFTPDEHGQNVSFQRVGKKRAGRLLDGRTWDVVPPSPAARSEQPNGTTKDAEYLQALSVGYHL